MLEEEVFIVDRVWPEASRRVQSRRESSTPNVTSRLGHERRDPGKRGKEETESGQRRPREGQEREALEEDKREREHSQNTRMLRQ